MARKIKGRGVVYGADGKVTLAGTIVSINTIQDIEVSDDSEIKVYKDSGDRTKTLVVPEVIDMVRLTLQPGGTTADAATIAEAEAQSARVEKLDNLKLEDLKPTDFNGTYVIWEASRKKTSSGVLQYVITAKKFEKDFSGAALSA